MKNRNSKSGHGLIGLISAGSLIVTTINFSAAVYNLNKSHCYRTEYHRTLMDESTRGIYEKKANRAISKAEIHAIYGGFNLLLFMGASYLLCRTWNRNENR